jgi:hypothetical protein
MQTMSWLPSFALALPGRSIGVQKLLLQLGWTQLKPRCLVPVSDLFVKNHTLFLLCIIRLLVLQWGPPNNLASVFLCFPKFVMLLKWQSSIRIFSQIWWCSKYGTRKSLAPFHIVGICDDFLNKNYFFKIKFPSKNREFGNRIFLLSEFFHFTRW